MTRSTSVREHSLARMLTFCLAFLAAGLLLPDSVHAAEVEVPVQGLLTETDGTPVDGNRQVTFKLYADDQSNGVLWESTISVPVDRGLFEVSLGGQTALDSDIFHANPQAHFTLTIEGDEESARVPLGYVPSAAYAVSATTADDAQTLQGETPADLRAGVTGTDVTFDDSNAGLGADDTQAAIETLLARVESLEQSEQDLQARVNALENIDVSGLETRVTDLESDLATNTSDISTLQTSVTGNSADISTVQTNVSANTSDITMLQTNVSANASGISMLQTSVGTNTSDLSTLQTSVSANTSDVSTLQSDVTNNDSRISSVETKTNSMSTATINGNDTVLFDGVNVQVRSGSGATDGTVNGTGNLIIGYNEGAQSKAGSHNLIVGNQHEYTSYGGIVGGYSSDATAPYASILTGRGGEAENPYAGILTGYFGDAKADYGGIVSGYYNDATGMYSAVLGGEWNSAEAESSAVGGGNYVTESRANYWKSEGEHIAK